jgi:hypothetical protein
VSVPRVKRCLVWLVLIRCLGIGAAAQGLPAAPEQAAMNAIRPEAIRAHMRFLSDSLLQGRAPGTPGYEIAARYVATQLEAAGVRPAGVNGTWYQTVPLRKSMIDEGKSSLVLVSKSGEQTLISLKDYVLYGDLNRTDASVEAPVVFVGFGVTATERDYDDYAGTDVEGKIVVLLDGAPAKFPSTVRAYYSDIIVKGRNAVAHGAVGFMDLMTPEDQKRYAWDWVMPQVQMGYMEWLENNGNPHNTFAELRAGALLNQSGAEKLLAGAKETLDQIFDAARASRPQSLALPVMARIHAQFPYFGRQPKHYRPGHGLRSGAAQPVCGLHRARRSSGNLSAGEWRQRLPRRARQCIGHGEPAGNRAGVRQTAEGATTVHSVCFCYRGGDGPARFRLLRERSHRSAECDRSQHQH